MSNTSYVDLILDTLKSKAYLATDVNGKIIAGSTPDLSGYVPYTGATTDVNLGSHNLTLVGNLSVTGNIIPQGALNLGGYGLVNVNPTQGNYDFVVSSEDDANFFRVDATDAGKVGIGAGSAPTALLHLGAGTATAGTAPLKLTSGTLLATPEAGALEFNTDSLYFTQTSSGTRHTLLRGTLTTTRILFASLYGIVVDNANLTFDATNNIVITPRIKLTPGSAPGTPAEGQIYVNSTDHHLYFYNGSGWVQCDN